MIPASGLFVVASLVLLAVGSARSDSALVYASLAASLAAFALLYAAIRRGLAVPGPELPELAPRPLPAEAPATVIVLPGIGQFHQPACPLLAQSVGARAVDRGEALARGYRVCERCGAVPATGPLGPAPTG